MLVRLLVDARQAVESPFHRPQYRRQPGALAGKDAGHEAAERLYQHNDDRAEERDLNPSIESYRVLLEPLRPQQGVDEIAEQEEGDGAAQQMVDQHGNLTGARRGRRSR